MPVGAWVRRGVARSSPGRPLRNRGHWRLWCCYKFCLNRQVQSKWSVQHQPCLVGNRHSAKLRAEVTFEESLNKAPKSAAVLNTHLTSLGWNEFCAAGTETSRKAMDVLPFIPLRAVKSAEPGS